MRTTNSNVETKRQNLIKTVQYILKHEKVSRQELAVALGFSLPTVFQNVTELMDWGLVREAGEYGSTGGRKAKVLQINEGFRSVVGVEIRKDCVYLVLLDLSQKVLDSRQEFFPYENSQRYYAELGALIQNFVRKNENQKKNPGKLIGVGMALPGIIDHSIGVLRSSAALDASNVGIRYFSQNIPYDFCCETAANSAAYVALQNNQKNAVYLALNDTVDGAVYIDGKNYSGNNYSSAVFGHVIVVPHGKKCFCGREGCLNAYCSSVVLTRNNTITLEQFFEELENGSPEANEQWMQYLDYLALSLCNIHMQFDCDIILGGNVGRCMPKYLRDLEEKIHQYSLFDFDTRCLSADCCTAESTAIGAAKYMIDRYIANLDTFENS